MMSEFYYRFIYWRLRKFLKWFCIKTKMQCGGKRRNGYAYEWCQLRAFHDGACLNTQNEFFAKDIKE
jgi:hypothetical protein